MNKIRILIPEFLKPILRSIYHFVTRTRIYKRITYRPKDSKDLHRYWSQPSDDENSPRNYLHGEVRSQFLVKIIKNYTKRDAKIIEIGCNAGRNLNYLFQSGFKKLAGIEINERAVQLLKKTYPEMAESAKIYNFAVEDKIKEFEDREFNVCFTMAVLEHIHTKSEWIFSEIVRITTDFLVTIEDERSLSWKIFPRNYKRVFEHLGMKQILEINCNNIDGLGRDFFVRVFKKS